MRLPNSKFFSRGFTIIELIVVITVIAILTSIAVVSFSSIQASARDAQRQQLIAQIQTALERYYGEYQTYPVQNSWGNMLTFGHNTGGGNTNGLCGPVSWAQGTVCAAGYFLSTMPRDPKASCPGPMTHGAWTPCGAGSRPSYSYVPSCSGGVCSGYTITLQKESGGTPVIFNSPQ